MIKKSDAKKASKSVPYALGKGKKNVLGTGYAAKTGDLIKARGKQLEDPFGDKKKKGKK